MAKCGGEKIGSEILIKSHEKQISFALILEIMMSRRLVLRLFFFMSESVVKLLCLLGGSQEEKKTALTLGR